MEWTPLSLRTTLVRRNKEELLITECWRNSMTNWELYAVLIATFGIVGCSARSDSASSQPSGTSSQAGKFFADPQLAALAAALERSDWAGADKAVRAGANVNAI